MLIPVRRRCTFHKRSLPSPTPCRKLKTGARSCPCTSTSRGVPTAKMARRLPYIWGVSSTRTPDDAYQLSYKFSTVSDDNYFAAVAVADDGPLGTSDYHIEFEIIPVDDKTFGRIHVSDHQSWLSSKAMHIYLATKGSDKQGIKVVGHDDKGNPILLQGRGRGSGEEPVAILLCLRRLPRRRGPARSSAPRSTTQLLV